MRRIDSDTNDGPLPHATKCLLVWSALSRTNQLIRVAPGITMLHETIRKIRVIRVPRS
jgi:hypothetical protein